MREQRTATRRPLHGRPLRPRQSPQPVPLCGPVPVAGSASRLLSSSWWRQVRPRAVVAFLLPRVAFLPQFLPQPLRRLAVAQIPLKLGGELRLQFLRLLLMPFAQRVHFQLFGLKLEREIIPALLLLGAQSDRAQRGGTRVLFGRSIPGNVRVPLDGLA